MKVFDLRHGGAQRDPSFSLWVSRERIQPGARFERDGVHGDEAVYVQEGVLVFDGRELDAGCVAVVESGAAAAFVAGDEGSTIVHFGPHASSPPGDGAYGPPQPAPRGVHLVGPRGLLAIEQPGRSTRFFADSACATCRLTLFSTARDHLYRSSSHSHSEDEILYVLDGEIRVGATTIEPDMGVMIPGGEVYGFRSGDSGFRFLNYRRDVSTYRSSLRKSESLERPRGSPDVIVVDDVR